MLKEIYEQPRAVQDTLEQILSITQQRKEEFKEFFSTDLSLIACGTSYHACCFGRYLFEKFCGLRTQAELASEFLYRNPVITGNYIFVS